MRGVARIAAEIDGMGGTRLARCGGTPPLTPRATGPQSVHLVSTAGGPLPGDRADLHIDVGPGATLVVRATAATVALPSPVVGTDASQWQIVVTVAEGATLIMLGEPLVAAAGCNHETRATVALLGDARLVWRDLLVPGRTAESPGDLSVSLRVSRAGRPVLSQTLAVGPRSMGWDGTAVVGGARCVGSLLIAGPDDWRPPRTLRNSGHAALTPLASPGSALGTALGDSPEVRRQLSAWLPLSIWEFLSQGSQGSGFG